MLWFAGWLGNSLGLTVSIAGAKIGSVGLENAVWGFGTHSEGLWNVRESIQEVSIAKSLGNSF